MDNEWIKFIIERQISCTSGPILYFQTAGTSVSGAGLTDHEYDVAVEECDASSEQTPVDPTFAESSIVG